MRPLIVLIGLALAALTFAACGSQGISLSANDPDSEGAELFSTSCSGCHTLTVVGSQGSGNRAMREQGPNFDQRTETYEDVLFSIRNGGYSGAIMPQNIVVGEQAEALARFLSKYAGRDVGEPNAPSPQEAGDVAAEESGNSPPASSTTTGGG